jgi:hypothetical protein
MNISYQASICNEENPDSDKMLWVDVTKQFDPSFMTFDQFIREGHYRHGRIITVDGEQPEPKITFVR